MKLSLCMIVKPTNKEAVLLDRCLSYIATHFDEICITQAGDKSNEQVSIIIKKYKAKESFFKWVNDFSKARNYNFKQATGDYIFWVDSDDVVRGIEHLRPLLEENEDVDAVVMWYLYHFDEYKVCDVKHLKTRVVKNDGCVQWEGNLHEDFKKNRVLTQKFCPKIEILHIKPDDKHEEDKERNLEVSKAMCEEKPKDPHSWWNLARSHIALGNAKEGIQYYKKFIKISKSEDEIYLAYDGIARCYVALQNLKAAIKYAFRAASVKPWFPDAYILLGEIYYSQRKLRHAKECLMMGLAKPPVDMEIIAFNPRDYDVKPLKLLTQIYVEMGRYDDALKAIETCFKVYPDHPHLKKVMEQIEEKRKPLKDLNKVLEKASKITDKKKLKKMLDKLPTELQSHQAVCRIRNTHFVKEESTGRDLVIFCGETSEIWSPESVKTGIGGSEEAVINLSQRFHELGWNVTVYANCGHEVKTYSGVEWKPYWMFNYKDKQDVVVIWRHPIFFEQDINATVKILDMHDVLPAGEWTERRLKNIDKIFVKSKAHRKLWPKISDDKFVIIPNGIDPSHFEDKVERIPGRLLYTSSPDRGLECLLKCFPKIKKEVPDAELHWFYGWHVFDAMHKDDQERMNWKAKIEKMIKETDGVFAHGRIGHLEIAKEYQKASVFSYPTEFYEIHCISAAKAQAAGAIPVTTNFAALDETVQFGVKVNASDIYTNERAQEKFIASVIKVCEEFNGRKDMMEWAKNRFNWMNIALKWDKNIKQLYDKKNV